MGRTAGRTWREEEDRESQREWREKEGWQEVMGGELVRPRPYCADYLGTVPSEKRPGGVSKVY